MNGVYQIIIIAYRKEVDAKAFFPLDIGVGMSMLVQVTHHGKEWVFEMINNILIEVLASIAEQERLTTRQRQEEGIAVAKEQGKHLGRPKAEFPSDWEETYKSWKQGELTAVAAMKHLGLKRSTFYNLVKLQEGRK